jgi:hypothetical protein
MKLTTITGMIKKLKPLLRDLAFKAAIAVGWRGKACATCHFTHASHFDKDLGWHPDQYPCDTFSKK